MQHRTEGAERQKSYHIFGNEFRGNFFGTFGTYVGGNFFYQKNFSQFFQL